jgi:general secretion pathway protein I
MLARRPPRRGISLIEVLLALAILLMSITAIGRLMDMGADHAADAIAQSTGIRLAQSKLAEVECGLIPVNAGGSGTIEEEPNWSYSIEAAASAVPNVYTVTVTLTRTGGRSHTVSMSQMICDPQAMGTAAPAQKPEAATSSGGTGQ